jgi:hypothetical protein
VTSVNPTPKFCKQQKEFHWIQMLNLNWIQIILIFCCSFSSLFFFRHFSYLLFLLVFLYFFIFLLILRPTSFSSYHDLILLLLLFHSGFCFWLFSSLFSFLHPFSCCTRADADQWIVSVTKKFIRLRASTSARQRTKKNVQDRANSNLQPQRDCLISQWWQDWNLSQAQVVLACEMLVKLSGSCFI